MKTEIIKSKTLVSRICLESLDKRIEIVDGEADVVASGEMAGVGDGRRGAPRTFWKLRGRISLDEVERESRRQIQPYNLEFAEIRSLYLLEPKYLIIYYNNTNSSEFVLMEKKKKKTNYENEKKGNFEEPLCRN